VAQAIFAISTPHQTAEETPAPQNTCVEELFKWFALNLS
jgi:hypothetical protein